MRQWYLYYFKCTGHKMYYKISFTKTVETLLQLLFSNEYHYKISGNRVNANDSWRFPSIHGQSFRYLSSDPFSK